MYQFRFRILVGAVTVMNELLLVFTNHRFGFLDFKVLISRDRFLFLKFRIIFTSYLTLKHISIMCAALLNSRRIIFSQVVIL
jgi:hypothetical protein